MSPEEFLAEFGTLAEAPGGVRKLREMILELAVRGKLASQIPEDEPAHALVERILTERDSLATRRQQSLNTAPFEVPPSWIWTTGTLVFDFITSGSRGWAQYYSDKGPIFLRIGNLDYGTTALDLASIQRVSPPVAAEGSRTRVQAGDVLISITGDIGMVGLVPKGIGEAYINQHIALARPSRHTHPPYIARAIMAPSNLGHLQQMQRGIKNSLGLDDIRGLRVPLPPLDEQKRIVAKIDQLMALCDELEAKQTQKQEAGARLTRSALDALTSAEGPEEFTTAWRRVADNFDVLSKRHDRIGEFRKAILGLALHGRLVEQAPEDEDEDEDEDADALLARISRDRTGNKVRGGRSTDTDESTQEETERHTLPESWRWVTVGEIADCVLGKMLDKAKHKTGVLRPYLRNINVRWGAFDLTDLLSMYFKDDELERYGVRHGDVLICEGGEPGRSAVWREPSKTMLIQKAIHRVRLLGGISPEWLVMNLRYDSWTGRLAQYFTGATIKHFTGQALTRYSIRLPPMAEQKRIIAKVDQLMALCDELETKLQDAEKGAERLAEAMTAAMVA